MGSVIQPPQFIETRIVRCRRGGYRLDGELKIIRLGVLESRLLAIQFDGLLDCPVQWHFDNISVDDGQMHDYLATDVCTRRDNPTFGGSGTIFHDHAVRGEFSVLALNAE